jgi:uncharacterized protein YukE
MAGIDVDSRKVKKAQEIYDDGVEKLLNILFSLNEEIVEINDLLQGYASGREEAKYQLSSAQYGALKDRFNLWLSNLRNPDQVLAHINNELRNKHDTAKKGRGVSGKKDQKPVVAQFSTIAKR